MTDEEITSLNITCAERLGVPRKFVIQGLMLSDAMYVSERRASGYEDEMIYADTFDEAEADKYIGKHTRTFKKILLPPPNFHGDLNAAMQLVERAKEMGWELRLDGIGDTWQVSFFPKTGTTDIIEIADTPAAAICEAFLKLDFT